MKIFPLIFPYEFFRKIYQILFEIFASSCILDFIPILLNKYSFKKLTYSQKCRDK